MVLQWYTRKVIKINKKIIYISLAVLVLILSASTVSALVSPPPGIKDPSLSKVWAAIMDLQTQIKGLVTQITGLNTRMTAVEAKAPKYFQVASPLNSVDTKSQAALCGSGQKVLGGGGAIGLDQPGDKVFIRASIPLPTGDGWSVVAEEATPTDNDWLLETFAICA